METAFVETRGLLVIVQFSLFNVRKMSVQVRNGVKTQKIKEVLQFHFRTNLSTMEEFKFFYESLKISWW